MFHFQYETVLLGLSLNLGLYKSNKETPLPPPLPLAPIDNDLTNIQDILANVVLNVHSRP